MILQRHAECFEIEVGWLPKQPQNYLSLTFSHPAVPHPHFSHRRGILFAEAGQRTGILIPKASLKVLKYSKGSLPSFCSDWDRNKWLRTGTNDWVLRGLTLVSYLTAMRIDHNKTHIKSLLVGSEEGVCVQDCLERDGMEERARNSLSACVQRLV